MKLRDRALVGILAIAFVALSVLALAPTLQSSDDEPLPTPANPTGHDYVEGVLGRATNASPFGARSTADRALVALLFRGLVRLGPGNAIAGDLAARWEVDEAGRTWTFHLRPEQAWGDGEPITAEDVAFTIDVLSDPAYTGPGAGTWEHVAVDVLDPATVALTPSTPLGGFLQAATLPIAPAHLLADVPRDELEEDAFGTRPIGSGPFRLVFLDASRALLAPTTPAEPPPAIPGRPNFLTPRPSDSLAEPPPTPRADVAIPYLSTMELRWYDDVESLRGDWAAGELHAASGLGPDEAADLATSRGARLVRYPGTTLLAATFDLRAQRPEFQDAAVRRALLEAIDRDRLLSTVLRGLGSRAASLIPPSSEMHDPEASAEVPFDPERARERLREAGWRESDGTWLPRGASEPLVVELLCPEQGANPVAYAAAAAVVEAWHDIGLAVRLVPLPSSELLGERIGGGDFQVAVLPLAIGLDPDLYPLLAASQTRSGGSNFAGLQDPGLDELLVAARTPVDPGERATAYRALQERLASRVYMLPLAFRDDYVVFRDTVVGPGSRPVGGAGDRFWDVLTWRLADGG